MRLPCSPTWPGWVPRSSTSASPAIRISPSIHDDLTVQSMWDKRLHATHIVSNLTFSAAVVGTWITRLRTRGVTSPVLLGVPGPVERSKLLAMATKIGVGESTRFWPRTKGSSPASRHRAGFTGERFVFDCARVVADPGAGVGRTAPVHVQPDRRDGNVARRAAGPARRLRSAGVAPMTHSPAEVRGRDLGGPSTSAMRSGLSR